MGVTKDKVLYWYFRTKVAILRIRNRYADRPRGRDCLAGRGERLARSHTKLKIQK